MATSVRFFRRTSRASRRRFFSASAALMSVAVLAPSLAPACPLSTPKAADVQSTYAFETPATSSRAVQTGLVQVQLGDQGSALTTIRIARAARREVGPGIAVHPAMSYRGAADLPLLPRLAPRDPRALRSTAPTRPLSTRVRSTLTRTPVTSAVTPQTVSLSTSYLTGLKPWWTYMSGSLVGVGSYDFNAATGNLVVRASDLSLRDKMLPIAFTRSYNSQSQHDYENTDGSGVDNYGEGWTNSFDAHIAANSGGGLTIFDGTGAEYDYTPNGSGGWTPPAGVHAQLTLDSCTCDYLWWMPNGTVYHFKNPTQSASNAALAGRLDSVYGRNRNAYLTLTYSFTNGDASSSANLSQIVAKTDDGRTITLTFADFAKSGGGSYRLLSTLLWPDGTTITYHYDGYGNLTQVDEPGNNAATALSQAYTYYGSSYPHLINLVLSPRYFMSSSTDGGYRLFDFNTTSRKLTAWCYHGFANPSIGDGYSSGPLQPAPAPTGIIDYRDFTATYNSGNTTVTDTTGHKVVFTDDSSNDRISAIAGYLSNGSDISVSKTYDANNNLVSVKDPRGNQTDMVYDGNGNLVAAAAPSATSGGATFRPTSYISYDGNNNPTAVCDPVWSHANGKDWTATPSPSDSLCAAGSTNTRATYTYPTYEPYGELATITTPQTASAPSGYTRTLSYPSSGDQGLPTSITGSAFTQADGTTWTPQTQLSYNAAGDPICYNIGGGWYVMQYDAMGRLTAVGDPDDKSLSGCGKSNGSYTTASYLQYYPNGQVKLSETPEQHASGTGMIYTYDQDGDLKTVTHHFVGTGNVTTYWYDAGDRLVEVQLPTDTHDCYTKAPWMRRYYYDLTGPQTTKTVSIGSTGGLYAHGGLYETQEYLPGTTISACPNSNSGSWTNASGQTYDALDRPIASYDLAVSTSAQRTRTYDASGQTGLLSSILDNLSETTTFSYDALRMTGISFSGTVTPNRSYTYDADSRPLSIASSGIGTQSYVYDDAGELTQSADPSGNGETSPGTLSYAHYPNGARQALSLSSTGLSKTNLEQYSYRSDGLPQTLSLALVAPKPFTWTYTNAGRMLTRNDPYTGDVISGVNSPYSGSYTLAAMSKTYDTYGRVASETLPMTGKYTNFTYDSEGEVTGYTGFYAPGDSTGKYPQMQAGYTYSARGELVELHHLNIGNSQFNAAWPHYKADAANGFLYPQPEPSASPPPTFTFEAIDDMALQKNQSSNGSVKAYTRDALGRQNKATLSGGSFNGNYTRSYDAEDHLLTHAYTSYTTPSLRPDCVGNDADDGKYTGTHTYKWGPNGHPIQIDGETLHWDGDQLLYTSTSSGTVDNVKAGLLADINPGNSEMLVNDRDDSGVVVSTHNSTGFSGWTPPDAYGQRCPAGAPPSSTTYANTYVNSAFAKEAMPASDGITDGYNVLQGGHGYDSKTGQWISNDVAGESAGDPMSAKPLMWNRNNPFNFMDPTGFGPTGEVVGGTAGGIGGYVGGYTAGLLVGGSIIAALVVLGILAPGVFVPLALAEGALDVLYGTEGIAGFFGTGIPLLGVFVPEILLPFGTVGGFLGASGGAYLGALAGGGPDMNAAAGLANFANQFNIDLSGSYTLTGASFNGQPVGGPYIGEIVTASGLIVQYGPLGQISFPPGETLDNGLNAQFAYDASQMNAWNDVAFGSDLSAITGPMSGRMY